MNNTAAANEAFVATETKMLEEMQQAEIARSKRIDEALANGEEYSEPHSDPQARNSINITGAGRK